MFESALQVYLQSSGKSLADIPPAFVAYLANLECVSKVSPQAVASVIGEFRSQRDTIKLIASENYSSPAVQSAMANLLTDKYAEGVPGSRFYSGCDNVDLIEQHACDLAKELFGVDHAYVQPHSGADANLVAFWAILSKRVELPALEEFGVEDSAELSQEQWSLLRQRLGNKGLVGMELSAGGHLTHGFRKNVSARMFDIRSYGVDPVTGLVSYEEISRLVKEFRPLILLAGYSAYSRRLNFAKFKEIADSVGAVLMVDMAHFAGLVAGKVFQGEYNPCAYADVITTTTHKTLRGPRGGLVLCKSPFAKLVDKGCPLVLGGPLSHVIASKAVCFTEALSPGFQVYAANIVRNAQALSEALSSLGFSIVSGGTENHLVLVDVSGLGLTGRQAERALRDCGLTLNRNTVPKDPNGAWYTSGLRLGTPAVTTLGMGTAEMTEIARIFALVLKNVSPVSGSKAKFQIDDGAKREAGERVKALISRYPVYPEIDLTFLEDYFDQSGAAEEARLESSLAQV